MASKVMVSGSTATPSCSSLKTPQRSRPSGSTRRETYTSKLSNSCPSRLGVIKQSITDKKFSWEVAEHVLAARRLSTRKVYDAKWTVFTNKCRQRKINPVLASPRIIADFLLHMFKEKKCQVSTIKGYRSMISNTLKFKSGTNIGSDPIISELIKVFEIQRPIQRSLAPKWDLACVLSSLCKDTHEPLHKASLLHLTMKTAILLMMATAKRVSEIHALAMDTEHLDKTDGSVFLRTLGFLQKINYLSQIWLKP